MIMAIHCTNCGDSDFYVQDAVYICSRCHLESAEHGQETALDEESLGTFASGTASTLKRK